MTKVNLVPLLRVQAASGTTLYPGENGFSAEWGEVEVQAPTLKQVLDEKVADGTLVNLRCGSLEITGRLREPKDKGEYRCYQIALEDVRYG